MDTESGAPATGSQEPIRTCAPSLPMIRTVPREMRVAKPSGRLVNRTSGVAPSTTSVAPRGTSMFAFTSTAPGAPATSENAAGTSDRSCASVYGVARGARATVASEPAADPVRDASSSCGAVSRFAIRLACPLRSSWARATLSGTWGSGSCGSAVAGGAGSGVW